MKTRSFICLAAIATALGWTAAAEAAVWRWGCSGAVGRDHLVFNRFQMLKLPRAIDAKRLPEIIMLDELRDDPALAKVPEKDVSVFTAEDANSGLAKTMRFLRDDRPGERLTLIETSSKVLSKRKIPGCRDEITMRFRKVYRLETGSEPARDVTLECVDYTLSTRGGRSCD